MMHKFGLTFHHFGLAARNKDVASLFLSGIGYTIGEFVLDPLQNVSLALCRGPTLPTIELVLPEGADGPLEKLLERQPTSFYHTGYLVPDPQKTLQALATAGIATVTVRPPKPAILFGNVPVSFHHVEDFGLIEFIHASTMAPELM